MQKEFIKGTIQTTLTSEMQQESEQKTCPTLISWLEDFLASLSQLQGVEKDSMTQEELSFLKSQEFSRTKNPNVFYLKMFGIYYLMTRETTFGSAGLDTFVNKICRLHNIELF